MKRIVFAFLALVMSCQLFAQNKLTGTILDGSMNNEPLIGASIIVEGTGTGGVSDMDGNFSITLPKGKTRIKVSSVGMKTQVINVAGKSHITITMQEDFKVMDEVVVVGYGTIEEERLERCLEFPEG